MPDFPVELRRWTCGWPVQPGDRHTTFLVVYGPMRDFDSAGQYPDSPVVEGKYGLVPPGFTISHTDQHTLTSRLPDQ